MDMNNLIFQFDVPLSPPLRKRTANSETQHHGHASNDINDDSKRTKVVNNESLSANINQVRIDKPDDDLPSNNNDNPIPIEIVLENIDEYFDLHIPTPRPSSMNRIDTTEHSVIVENPDNSSSEGNKPNDEMEYAIPLSYLTHSSQGKTKEKGLGSWYFNKKTRKRCYVSLTGRILTGFEAFSQCRQDKDSLLHPSKSSRAELRYLMSMTPQTESDFVEALSSIFSPSSKSRAILSTWGIPPSIVNVYRKRNIEQFFDWQVDCLLMNNGAPLRGQDLIYSAPTSGGKTLVSEILMLRRLALNPGLILFVVPFIALVEEKTNYFQDVWKNMYIGIRSYHSEDIVRLGLSDDIDVAVCTIERANILLNQLFDEKKENRLKMIVIDEIHMLSDKHRGFLLEVILSKVKFILHGQVQIIGMSATLPNIQDFSSWLNSCLYTTEYRPVNLCLYIARDRQLMKYTCQNSSVGGQNDEHSNELLNMKPIDKLHQSDYDGFLSLVFETAMDSKSVMVFCSSRKRCEDSAMKIAEALHMKCHQSSDAVIQSFREKYFNSTISMKRNQLLESLNHTSVGLCPVLRITIPYGVAYHNGGLTVEERKIIEDGYRQHILTVLCTTSTLSAGVNLPAHRVIIRDTKMGIADLTVSAFRQMCGRAGRMGLDSEGEAILMITGREWAIGQRLLTSDLDPLTSSLHEGSGGGIEKLLLEMICCQKLIQANQISKFIACTLYYVQHPRDLVLKNAQEAVLFLLRNAFIQCQPNEKKEQTLLPTPLGKATCLSGIAPKEAVIVIKSLEQAKSKLILKSGLHATFLVTPPSTAIEPNWEKYDIILETFFREHPAGRDVAEFVGIDMSQIMKYKLNKPNTYGNTNISTQSEDRILFYRRFYSAMILFSLIQEQAVTKALEMIIQSPSFNRGQLQQLQKDASTFCHMTVTFCKNLNWDLLGSYLEVFASRLEYGARDEIVPLLRIGPEMTSVRAREFFRKDIKTPLELVNAGLDTVKEILMSSLPYEATDPLRISSNKAANQKDLENTKQSIERLATKILARAKEALRQELSLLNGRVHSA